MAGAVADSVTGWLDLIWICTPYYNALSYYDKHARTTSIGNQTAASGHRTVAQETCEAHASHDDNEKRWDDGEEEKKKKWALPPEEWEYN